MSVFSFTNQKMFFDVIGEHIEYDVEFANYYLIRKAFSELALKLLPQIQEDFPAKFENPEDFAEKGRQWAIGYFAQAVNLSLDILSAAKCYSIDEKSYYRDYFDIRLFSKPFEKVCEQLTAINESEEERDNARKARTQAAGNSWQGGGFGLSGAIKGAVQAEALNLAGAAVSGTFNLLGKGISSIGNASKKNSILNSDETKNAIVSGLFNSIKLAYYEVIECLAKNTNFKFPLIGSDKNDQTKVLISNLESGRIPEDDFKSVIRQVLELNPYNKDIYLFMLGKYGDSDSSIENMANTFEVNSVTSKKLEFLDAFYKTLDLTTEEKALNAREIIKNKAEELTIFNFTQYQPLEDLLNDYDIKARTFNNTVYPTREEAIQKRKEFTLMNFFLEHENEINKIKSYDEREGKATSLYALAVDKAQEIGLQFFEKGQIIEEYIQQRIKDLIRKIDIESKTIGATVFPTRQEAINMRNRLVEASNFFKQCEEKSIFVYPNIPKDKIENAIRGYGIPVDPGLVILLFDATTFGSADEGIIITLDTLFCKIDNSSTRKVNFDSMHKFSCKKTNNKMLGGFLTGGILGGVLSNNIKKLQSRYEIILDDSPLIAFNFEKLPIIVDALNEYVQGLKNNQMKIV